MVEKDEGRERELEFNKAADGKAAGIVLWGWEVVLRTGLRDQ